MFDIYVIESVGEFYYAERSGGTGFRGPKEAQLFRNMKKAKATIRRIVRTETDHIIRQENRGVEEKFLTSDREKLVRWQAAKVLKLKVVGLTDA